MKLRISAPILLFALAIPAFADYTSTPSVAIPSTGKFYIGAFGGAGSSDQFKASQLGTVFLTEAEGGPLSVNAEGNLGRQSVSLFGMQIGYQAQNILLNSSSQWALAPAAELEGYTMSSSTFNGTLNNTNSTDRDSEGTFTVSYPMNRSIFLANAVLNFNNPNFSVHPYIGLGIGGAIIKISNASATQTNPAEAGINHYNSNTSDTSPTLAGQMKLGFSYDINKYVSLFADYRLLYVADTNFEFGSTSYTTHSPTSDWQVKMGSQLYNLGTAGIRFNL